MSEFLSLSELSILGVNDSPARTEPSLGKRFTTPASLTQMQRLELSLHNFTKVFITGSSSSELEQRSGGKQKLSLILTIRFTLPAVYCENVFK